MGINMQEEYDKERYGVLKALDICFDKKFFPEKPMWERALYTLKSCFVNNPNNNTDIQPDRIKNIFPITLSIFCGCEVVINTPQELRTIECPHGNYLIKIEEI